MAKRHNSETRMREAWLRDEDVTEADAPMDVDTISRILSRRAAGLSGAWRACVRPNCKRARGCTTRTRCHVPRGPSRPQTREQEAAMMARIRRMLAARLASFGGPESGP